jgi:hypothetical protein
MACSNKITGLEIDPLGHALFRNTTMESMSNEK